MRFGPFFVKFLTLSTFSPNLPENVYAFNFTISKGPKFPPLLFYSDDNLKQKYFYPLLNRSIINKRYALLIVVNFSYNFYQSSNFTITGSSSSSNAHKMNNNDDGLCANQATTSSAASSNNRVSLTIRTRRRKGALAVGVNAARRSMEDALLRQRKEQTTQQQQMMAPSNTAEQRTMDEFNYDYARREFCYCRLCPGIGGGGAAAAMSNGGGTGTIFF